MVQPRGAGGAGPRTPARGTLFGNRGGCFHTEKQELLPLTRWKGNRWIACRLEFKGRHRELMQPNRYTELFFLDEATALAAGHRPCAQGRRVDFNGFIDAWLAGDSSLGIDKVRCTDAIDRDEEGRVRYHYTLVAVPATWQAGEGVAGDDAAAVAWLSREEILARGLWTAPALVPLIDLALAARR